MSRMTVTPVETPRQTIRRLRNQAYNEQTRRERLEKEVNRAARQTNQRISDIEENSKRQEQRHDQAISGLQSDIQEAERLHHERLIQFQKNFNSALKNQENRLNTKINNVRNWAESELINQRREYLEITRDQQKQINHIDLEVQKIKNTEANTEEIVRKRLHDVQLLIDETDKNEPHQRFAPGELVQIRNKLHRAESDLNKKGANFASGVNQAVWQTYDELVLLREKVYEKKNEFQREYLFTLQLLEILLGIVNNDEIDVPTKNKKIDFWTDGKFSELKEKVEKLKINLENRKDTLTLEEVKQMQNTIKAFEEEQEKIVDKAVNNVIASQQRKEMAKDVALKLINSGDYQFVDGNGYEGDDPRGSYIIRIKKSDAENATETTAIITPREIKDDSIQNMLALNSTDHFPDDESARQNAAEVAAVLENQEVAVGNTKCAQSEHDPDLAGEKIKNYLKLGRKIPKESKQNIS